jgi:hypothetical protein
MDEEAQLVADLIRNARSLPDLSPERLEASREGQRMLAEAFEKYGWNAYSKFWALVQQYSKGGE